MVILKGYKVSKMSIENRVQGNTELKLQNTLNYNVNYAEDDKKCWGIVNFSINDANGMPFNVTVDMVAEFTYEDGDEKPFIHTTSFDSVFPYLRMLVTNLTSNSGMPGLIIPIMKLNPNTVRVESKKETSPLN